MPKHVKIMILDACPHCQTAFQIMDDLIKANPEYHKVEFEVIEGLKEPHKTVGYDYWYVPAFFVEDEKIHEGVPTVEVVDMVFKKALE